MTKKLVLILITIGLMISCVSAQAEEKTTNFVSLENCRKVGNNVFGSVTRFEDGGHIADWTNFQRSIGTLRTLIIPIDLPDARAESSILNIKEFGLQLKNEFSRLSQGKLNLEIEVMPNWVTLSKTSSFYASNSWTKKVIDAFYAADQVGIDFSRFDLFIVKADPKTYPLEGTGALPNFGQGQILWDGVNVLRGAFLGKEWADVRGGIPVAIHEILHVLGLPDLYLVNLDGSSLSGKIDIMGRNIPSTPYLTSLLEWNRWKLGWSQESLLTCIDGTKSHLLKIILDDSESSSVFIDLGDTVLALEAWQDYGKNNQKSLVVYEITPKTYVWASGLESGKISPIQIIRPKNAKNSEGTFFVGDLYSSDRFGLRFIQARENHAYISFTPTGQKEISQVDTRVKDETAIKSSINCFKGKVTKKISGINPKCPAGYKVER